MTTEEIPLKQGVLKTIRLDAIKVVSDLNRVNSDVSDICESIITNGIINPPTINARNELICGGRRFRALKEIGYEEAQFMVIEEQSELEQELCRIDENIVRLDFIDTQTEKILKRRKEIYLQLHPETKAGVAGGTGKVKATNADSALVEARPSFVEDTAKKTGKSKRTIDTALARAEKSSNKVTEAREKGEIKTSSVSELVKLPKEDQDKLLPYLTNKSVSLAQDLVAKAKKDGVDSTIDGLIAQNKNNTEMQRENKYDKGKNIEWNRKFKLLYEAMANVSTQIKVVFDHKAWTLPNTDGNEFPLRFTALLADLNQYARTHIEPLSNNAEDTTVDCNQPDIDIMEVTAS